MSFRSVATLVRHLGPWGALTTPKRVHRHDEITPRGLRIAWYRGTRPARGTYVISPGLHFLGPDDPRLDRFCRVLCQAGFLVVAPFVRPLLGLRVSPESTRDLAEAFVLADRAGAHAVKPHVFSVSFGSQPAISLAARPAHRERVGKLLLFGGYADFEATVLFAAGEKRPETVALPRDPSNLPAVFLNLAPQLVHENDVFAIEQAWLRMARATWGTRERHDRGVLDVRARRLASGLPEHLRSTFLLGCGVEGDPLPVVMRSLAASAERLAFADPRPELARVQAPVVIVHGRDDDVIPYNEAEKLRSALPEGHTVTVHLTGLYGHASAHEPALAALGEEVRTLLSVARELAR